MGEIVVITAPHFLDVNILKPVSDDKYLEDNFNSLSISRDTQVISKQ